MSQKISVKVSSRYQIAVPQAARRQLNIQRGDRLLVDIQDELIVLIPAPTDHTAQLAGLHKEIWQDIDADAYLRGERDAWDTSAND
jgi:AbrB family looped-hinge helix DNA binding protein